MSLSGRVALVTGGGRGIGRAIALGLAEDGADVAVNYRRDADAAQETVSAIQKLGRRARAFRASVDRFEEDEAMVADALAEFGHIDILINNAGLASRGRSVAKTDPEEFERVMRIHAFAPHYLSKLVLPSSREAPHKEAIQLEALLEGRPLVADSRYLPACGITGKAVAIRPLIAAVPISCS